MGRKLKVEWSFRPVGGERARLRAISCLPSPCGASLSSERLGTARTDRNPAVDRETARRNMTAGLVAGGFAAAIFALCFIVALLYIAHG